MPLNRPEMVINCPQILTQPSFNLTRTGEPGARCHTDDDALAVIMGQEAWACARTLGLSGGVWH